MSTQILKLIIIVQSLFLIIIGLSSCENKTNEYIKKLESQVTELKKENEKLNLQLKNNSEIPNLKLNSKILKKELSITHQLKSHHHKKKHNKHHKQLKHKKHVKKLKFHVKNHHKIYKNQYNKCRCKCKCIIYYSPNYPPSYYQEAVL